MRQIQGANQRRFLHFPCLRVFHPTAPKQAKTASNLGSSPASPAGGGSQTSTNIPTWEKVLQLLVTSLKSLQLSTSLVCSVFCIEHVGCSSTDPPQNLLLLLLLQPNEAWELLLTGKVTVGGVLSSLVDLVKTCRGSAKSQVKDQSSGSGKAA